MTKAKNQKPNFNVGDTMYFIDNGKVRSEIVSCVHLRRDGSIAYGYGASWNVSEVRILTEGTFKSKKALLESL